MPKALTHEHHRWPRAAGGGDEPRNLVRICPTCHNAVDRGANALCKGRTGIAQSIVEQYLPSDLNAQHRLMHLISTQAHAWKTPKARDERRVILTLDVGTHSALKFLASLYIKTTKTGKSKSMGVTQYMERVLFNHVKQKAEEGILKHGTCTSSEEEEIVSIAESPRTLTDESESITQTPDEPPNTPGLLDLSS